jgi:hypothetical protein
VVRPDENKNRRHGDVISNRIGIVPTVCRTAIVHIAVVFVADRPVFDVPTAGCGAVITAGFLWGGHNGLLESHKITHIINIMYIIYNTQQAYVNNFLQYFLEIT